MINVVSGGHYLDATFGRGGHADEILQRIGDGRLLLMDKDPGAIKLAAERYENDARVSVFHGSFANIGDFVRQQGLLGTIDGILLDLGVSSPQLDDPSRGFSFRMDGPLDMRMNPDAGISAAAWIATVGERELSQVLRDFGEERFARRIARAIIKSREEEPILRTAQLASIVAHANPAWEKDKDPATRTFQAIRIFINSELADIKLCLNQILDVLAPKGRLVVISFHSLEDRIVKRFMRAQARGDNFPPDLPIRAENLNPRLKLIGKALRPSDDEIGRNPRARSAVMRVAEKCYE